MEPLIDYDSLDWDDWNVTHILKHDVTPTEVEEVMASDSIVVRQTYKNRLQVTGLTFHGRVLAVVIGPAPDNPRVYYTFSARPASRKERRFYQEQREP